MTVAGFPERVSSSQPVSGDGSAVRAVWVTGRFVCSSYSGAGEVTSSAAAAPATAGQEPKCSVS